MPFFALGYVYVRQRLQAGAAVLQIASDGQINSFRAFARKDESSFLKFLLDDTLKLSRVLVN
jgi:hypothetical protein